MKSFLASSHGWRHGLTYGLMGLPLAFVALPLYVILPNYYAREFGVPLAALGTVLLGTRLLDALIDPLLGRWSDRLFQRSTQAVLRFGTLGCILLGLGFALLFLPPVREPQWLLALSAVFLMLTYAAFSAVTVAHQSWGALLGGNDAQQSYRVAWREGLGLVGVILASIMPTLLGMGSTVVSFWLMLLLGLMAWHMSKRPNAHPAHTRGEPSAEVSVWLPFKREAFCRLLAVFVVNGIASAIPATLVLFFIQDRLAADTSMEPVFLGIFFVCAALSMPGWVKLVTHLGLTKSWLMGMLLSVLVFIWASQLGRGDANAYFVICALSGFALGADLALPSAILAGVIARSGDLGQSQGAFFGWWNFATKLNLAFAAGIALPLLAWMGYVPGTQDPEALRYLTFAYCVLPCFLKLTASLGLYVLVIRAPDLFPTER